MNRELALKLIEYIDARIAEAMAGDSSDGGLIEAIQTRDRKEEFLHLVDVQPTNEQPD